MSKFLDRGSVATTLYQANTVIVEYIYIPLCGILESEYLLVLTSVVFNWGIPEPQGSASTLQGLHQKLYKCYDRQYILNLQCR